jgi:hypothetical protein
MFFIRRKEDKMKEDKEEITKGKANTRQGQFQCWKCLLWEKLERLHILVCFLKVHPIDFPNQRFSSKTEVPVCEECFKGMRK